MKQKTKILVGSLITLVLVFSLIYLLLPKNLSDDIITQEKIPLKVGYKATSHYLSIFVAQEEGFFAEEGLDAELVKFESSNQVMDAVLAGQLDAGRGGIILQLAVEEKQPNTLKTILLNKQTKENYIDFILVRKDSPFTHLKNFKGVIGTNAGSVEKIHLSAVLKKLGISSQIKILEMKPELLPSALESKQVDAIFTYEPIINTALESGKARILEAKPIENYLFDPWIGGGVFLKASTIKNEPEKAKKIFRAFYKAGKFIEEHPEEAKAVLLKYAPINQKIIQQLHALPEYNPFEHPGLINSLQANADMFYEEGYLGKKIDVKDILVDLR